MKCSITPIKEGIIRISKQEDMPEKYMENLKNAFPAEQNYSRIPSQKQ